MKIYHFERKFKFHKGRKMYLIKCTLGLEIDIERH